MLLSIGATITSRSAPPSSDPAPESELYPWVPLDLLAAYHMIAMPITIMINPKIRVLSFKLNHRPPRKVIIPNGATNRY